MTQVHWLIDAEACQHYADELASAVRRASHSAELLQPPRPPYRWEDVDFSYRDLASPDRCVLLLGAIDLATHIYREGRWKPGVFCTVENFYYTKYAPRFAGKLLNEPYQVLPFYELTESREELFNGRDAFFARPDSPLKYFTGQLVTRGSFEKDLEFMGFYEFPRDASIVVSAPRKIVAEWRFVAAKHQVIAGCQYKRDGEFAPSQPVPPEARSFAVGIAAGEYQPDPVWVFDVCQLASGKYRLIEIGGFSFSDLYACDKDAVARAVSQAAATVYDA